MRSYLIHIAWMLVLVIVLVHGAPTAARHDNTSSGEISSRITGDNAHVDRSLAEASYSDRRAVNSPSSSLISRSNDAQSAPQMPEPCIIESDDWEGHKNAMICLKNQCTYYESKGTSPELESTLKDCCSKLVEQANDIEPQTDGDTRTWTPIINAANKFFSIWIDQYGELIQAQAAQNTPE